MLFARSRIISPDAVISETIPSAILLTVNCDSNSNGSVNTTEPVVRSKSLSATKLSACWSAKLTFASLICKPPIESAATTGAPASTSCITSSPTSVSTTVVADIRSSQLVFPSASRCSSRDSPYSSTASILNWPSNSGSNCIRNLMVCTLANFDSEKSEELARVTSFRDSPTHGKTLARTSPSICN